MSGSVQPDYKKLYEHMEKAVDETTARLLDTYSNCQIILESCGVRKSPFSEASEQRLDALVSALRSESEFVHNVDYRKMYLTLFNAMTSAIQHIEWQNYERAREILIHAQQETEEIYMQAEE